MIHHHVLKRRLTPAPTLSGPLSGSTIAAAEIFIGRENDKRAPWPRCCVLQELCKREPADGAKVFLRD
jgi:hypothetical protein